MIIDTIDNLCKYAAINPLFEDVVEFLKSHDLKTMEVGKYPIKDKDLFLNLTVAKGKTKEECRRALDFDARIWEFENKWAKIR